MLIAEANGKKLYLSDIPDIFPEGVNRDDSVNLLKSYANSWVRKQLTLSKAEENLTEQQKNVAHQLDDYRTSLLIYRYEQEYISQRLDTLVTPDEIKSFYDANKDKLRLSNPLAKAVFIKVANNAPGIKRIKEIYRLNSEDKIEELDVMCLQVAEKYDYFNDDWVDFSTLTKYLPQAPSNYESEAQRNKYIEEKVADYTYLINIREFIPRGDFAPMEYQKKVITSIILNNRKQKMVTELEQKIYDDAIQKKTVSVTVEER